MEKIYVRGGRKLNGEVSVSGMKNAALPILIATLLVDGKCTLENVPSINDVNLALDILRFSGAEVTSRSKTRYAINTAGVLPGQSPYELDNKMRASAYLLGAELGRFGYAKVGWPGGCNFGLRPLDQHVKGFKALGATTRTESGYIVAEAPEGLHGAPIHLDIPSVGATVNIILAAALADGVTTIDNAAKEPHIVDLANFLNHCGADITGAGTSTIRVRGVKRLCASAPYTIAPDMIEAGTYMVAAAATGGRVTVKGVIPKHVETVSAKLIEMGVKITENPEECSVTVDASGELTHVNIKTFYYPGFPTDMQPQFAPLLCKASGVSTINEAVWDNRFRYVEELRKMGADIAVDGSTATFMGDTVLQGAPVVAVDLRAGAAMIIAGLIATGRTEISDVEIIDRGFFNIVGKFRKLGADIRRVFVPDEALSTPAKKA